MADTKKEYLNQAQENGNINISEEVVATISAVAAQEIKGVATLGTGGVSGLIGKKSPSKGVKVLIDEKGNTTVDIYLTVKFGDIVPAVAIKVQDAVVKALDDMACISSASVNVHITGVVFDKDDKSTAKKA